MATHTTRAAILCGALILVAGALYLPGQSSAERPTAEGAGKMDPVPVALCEGCEGSRDNDSAVGGASCPGTISISGTVTAGECYPTDFTPPGHYNCEWTPCTATITRSWSGMNANVRFDWCVSLNGAPPLCIDPPPSSGANGRGQDTKTYPVPCGTDLEWSFSTGCGMSVSASGSCSECDKG